MTRPSKTQAKIAFSFYTLFCLWPCFSFSQDVDTAWVRRYNGLGNGNDNAVAIAVDDSGNVYVTGSSFDSITGYDYCTIKYLPNGDTAWVRWYNGPANKDDFASALVLDDSGNVYITGRGNGDYATIKYSSAGQQLWTKRLGFFLSDSNDGAYALAIDGNGNIWVTGRIFDDELLLSWVTIKYDSQGNERWTFDTHIPAGTAFAITIDDSDNVYVMNSIGCIKYDSLGNRLWFRSYPGVARDIALDKGGNLYIVGDSGSFFASNNFILIKYDSAGNQLWVRRSNSIPDFSGYSASLIAMDNPGNLYVLGTSYYFPDAIAWMIVKYDSAGNQLWYGDYYGINYPEYREPKAVALDGAGNLFITGEDAGRYSTIKLSSQRELLWATVSNYASVGRAIALNDAGNVYVTGFTGFTGLTESDFLTIKYSPLPQLRGDLNLDGALSVEDVIYSVNYIFSGVLPPAAPAACDLNCDGRLSGADIVILLRMVFLSAPAPC